MKNFFINNSGKKIECPPYLCKMCGMFEILFSHKTCDICAWSDDVVQNLDRDYEGGENTLSFNHYKSIWEQSKDYILKQQVPWRTMMDLTREIKMKKRVELCEGNS